MNKLSQIIDVVPVDPSTATQWIHPPYSGHFDGMVLPLFRRISRDEA